MAVRVVNGNTWTEDGWPLVDQAGCTWIRIPGTSVTIQVQTGLPCTMLGAWEADWNAYIEPLEDPTTGCWTEGNSVLGGYGKNNGSNHLGGTAVDSDWERHPMGPEAPDPAAGFSQAQYDEMQRMKDFYTFTAKDGTLIQLVWWANDWNSPHDSMHSQMGYDTYQYRDEVLAWCHQFIRADGFSTYRRGNAPVTAAPILAAATGISEPLAEQILPTMQAGLVAADCTSVLRIAMFFAQTGEESASYATTEEYASGAEYEGRCSDLGNCSPGDGVKYKGRTWIQVTGKAHYGEFSQWCFNQGLVPTVTWFVDNPTALADMQWAGLGAAWYWTVERPNINAMCDAGDVLGVTKAINGGTNGLADRQARYNRALAMGDQLLAILNSTPGDDMATVPQEQWDRVYRELTQLLDSRSPLRHLGEGAIDTMAGFVLNTDGSVHVEVCIALAGYGHPPTLALLHEVANADPVLYPDRQEDAKIASAILADLAVPAPVAVANAAPVAQAYVPPQVVYVPQPTPAPVAVQATAAATTPGQLIGQAYDALSALPTDLGDADKASLISLLQVLGRLAGLTSPATKESA